VERHDIVAVVKGQLVLAATFFASAVLCLPESPEIEWTIYLRRADPVRIGRSLAKVRRVLRDPRAYLEGNAPEAPLNECAYLLDPAHSGIAEGHQTLD
jgi:hypothetical protein